MFPESADTEATYIQQAQSSQIHPNCKWYNKFQ